VKSFETITRRLRPECFDPVAQEHHTVVPFKRDKVFFHSGDFGDIIYALPTIRALGGGKLIIGPSTHWKTRLRMCPEYVNILRPLLAVQPYIHEVEFCEKPPTEIDIDLNRFREYLVMEHILMLKGARRLNLAEAHLYTFKLPLTECEKAWLTVDRAEPLPEKPVLIHRSHRWLNPKFPWTRIMERHAHHAVFVGLESEHEDFVKDWGHLPYLPTKNFLELARLIAGCRLYIGNQSLPYALCEGLKRDSLLEVWLEGPNCLFSRKNAIYGESAAVYIPKISNQMNTILKQCPICAADATEAARYRENTDIVQCPQCALVYLRTHPDEAATLMYYQQYADDHSHMRLPKNFEDIRTSGLRREYFMQELLALTKPTGAMLDIGCGWGAFLANAREKGFTPYGVDVCHKAANFAAATLGIPTICDELKDCLFTVSMFEVVVAIHTLEHLSKPADALKHIHQLLKPDGLFCGIVPNIESFCSQTKKEKWQWLDINTHYTHFSPATLKHALEKHGFEVIKTYTHTGDYDQNELRQLLQEREGRALSPDELSACLSHLWESGQGEEIRFFAKAQ
jgi:2-polyprenyl-3-methyl-5-hydroxy-6-metoxy-1,4-benzoquinol methylase